MAEFLFEALGISKSFPGVMALQDVSLQMREASIHALLGENGAGKSTLIKIITGIHRPDAGELRLAGTPIELTSPRDAMAKRIGVVHQERNLIPRFSVGENIYLEQLAGRPLKPLRYPELYRQSRKWLDLLDLDVDPATPVSRLSVAKMQLVEIAKALALDSRVLLLDEPTASLTPHETVTLFKVLKRLRDDGVSMLFVSHKLEEVGELCDQVTVLRDGRNAAHSQPLQGLGRQDLVQLMIGRKEQIADWPARNFAAATPALALKGVSTILGHRDIDLTVKRGEILGLYGLVGAGRTELAKCIIGQFAVTEGSVEIQGKAVKIASVADAIHRHGIGYVSEDRKAEGLILMHSVLANAGITVWRNLGHHGLPLTDGRIRSRIEPFVRRLEVRTPSLAQLVGNLSGGNQQKISVAKWLAAGVKVLIVDEPSVGIDIKTKAYLHELLRELSDTGTAVLVITSDMPEMITLADRIAVMNDYRIEGTITNTRDYEEMSSRIMSLIHRVEAA
ncbi:sugar ABC transporter ATP-binding protein [Acidisoma sp. L85]|jgi:ribose transport system ATP-binding protein|uniref:sugar ABC transporter ATP-binding protein n=1 Tax=Acidisoma sp. L85 TaxID=1641850 RepID=UPI00131C6DB8|nr:sugar ABC transporter ATP-binding protein [Acidisoma sp. L85]